MWFKLSKYKVLFFVLNMIVATLNFNLYSQHIRRSFSQHEIGVFGGGTYYRGDLNQSTHFTNIGLAYGVYYRYCPNYRFAYKIGWVSGAVAAQDAESNDPAQRVRNLSFSSKIDELHIITEFNFLNYRLGHKEFGFSTYMYGGLAMFWFNPQTNLNGNVINLSTIKTENQSYSLNSMAIPFGIGIKFNILPRLAATISWGTRFTYTDYLDDVSNHYVYKTPNTLENELADRSIIKTNNVGNQRGNNRNNDWYFVFGGSIVYKINKKKNCFLEASKK